MYGVVSYIKREKQVIWEARERALQILSAFLCVNMSFSLLFQGHLEAYHLVLLGHVLAMAGYFPPALITTIFNVSFLSKLDAQLKGSDLASDEFDCVAFGIKCNLDLHRTWDIEFLFKLFWFWERDPLYKIVIIQVLKENEWTKICCFKSTDLYCRWEKVIWNKFYTQLVALRI